MVERVFGPEGADHCGVEVMLVMTLPTAARFIPDAVLVQLDKLLVRDHDL